MDDPRRFVPNLSGLHPLALPVNFYAQGPQAAPAFVAPISAYNVYQVDGRAYKQPVVAAHLVPGTFPYQAAPVWQPPGSVPLLYMSPYQNFHHVAHMRGPQTVMSQTPAVRGIGARPQTQPVASSSSSVNSTKAATASSHLRAKDTQHGAASSQPVQPTKSHDPHSAVSYSGDDGDVSGCISDNNSCSSIISSSSSWGWLLEGILQQVLQGLPDSDIKHFRQVCKHWRDVSDQNLEKLSPSCLKSKTVLSRFPRLKSLQLINCPNVRNRDLFILSQGHLPLEVLTIGDESNKPWVTNRGLSSIAQMTSIRRLSLHDCNSVTNKGLACLIQMKPLKSLSLRGCKKITNNGLEVLQHLKALTSLNLIGCVRISDKALQPLTKLSLESVHLGHTRIRDEGMSYLAHMTSLRDLHCTNEDMTDTGVKQLTTLSKLERLAIQKCPELSGQGLLHLLPSLTALTHLDLFHTWDYDDEQLAACIPHLSGLRSLDLRGTWVTESGISQLQHLGALESLCLAPQYDMWSDALCIINVLTQLTSLTVNTSHLSLNFLRAVRCLSRLKSLNLSDEGFSENMTSKEPLQSNVVEQLASLTTLTSLDLSKRPVQEEQLAALAKGLHRLSALTIYGCPLTPASVVSLQKQFPHLTINCKDTRHESGSVMLPADVRLVVT